LGKITIIAPMNRGRRSFMIIDKHSRYSNFFSAIRKIMKFKKSLHRDYFDKIYSDGNYIYYTDIHILLRMDNKIWDPGIYKIEKNECSLIEEKDYPNVNNICGAEIKGYKKYYIKFEDFNSLVKMLYLKSNNSIYDLRYIESIVPLLGSELSVLINEDVNKPLIIRHFDITVYLMGLKRTCSITEQILS
jgi:hypothetical protein